MASNTPLAVARACLQAYVDKNRDAMEALLDEDFHFTSPIDNALDRATYMKICWPNSGAITRFEEIYGFEKGDRAVVVYEAHTSTGKRKASQRVLNSRGRLPLVDDGAVYRRRYLRHEFRSD